jgi:FMN hydrolase / 5-amino-6-(5-phospho-D-ribitylamino)uracil phosphatase
MKPGAIRAICFDLDNTLWDVGPVLERADRILADWLEARYPRIPQRFTPGEVLEVRAALLREQPHQAHDLTWLRRETFARLAAEVGYEPDMAHEAFELWHRARNLCVPFADVVPALDKLALTFRLATLSNGNADLTSIGMAHHFEVSLNAAALGCAKPDARTYAALTSALTLQPAEILFVGDEPHADIAGPRNAGMQTVWVNRGGDPWPVDLAPPDHVIAGFDELVALLTTQV